MKTKIFIPILLMISTQITFSQSWFEDGNTWVYNWQLLSKDGWEEIKVSGDTMIEGKNCKILNSQRTYKWFDIHTNSYKVTSETPPSFIVYQEGEQIFTRNKSNEFILQYDFSLEPGDSIYLKKYYGWGCEYVLVLDSIGVTSVQNEQLRTQYFTGYGIHSISPDPDISMKVLEFVGLTESVNNSGEMAFFIPGVMNTCGADGPIWTLRCYSNDQFSSHNLEDCYELIVSEETSPGNNQRIKVLPNPAKNYLEINNPGNIMISNSSVFSVSGKLEWISNTDISRIPVFELPAGIYFLLLEGPNAAFRFRFCKSE